MPPIFGRSVKNPHPYDAAIAGWLNRNASTYAVMARNVMYDSRVSDAREEDFDTFTGNPTTSSELKEALEFYLDVKVRYTKTPAYLDETLNGINFISPTIDGKLLVSRRVHLARLLDLNGLEPVFLWAKENRNRWFADFPQDPKRISEWLNDRILTGRASGVNSFFIEAVLAAMNGHRKESAYQPTWATTWEAFKPYVSAGPDRWLEIMGMRKEFSDRWLMVLRYTVHEAGRLVRPTQLDGGWQPWHFPSLPDTNGHPMDLRIQPPAPELLPEFIHDQIDHTIEHWVTGGSLCRRTVGLNGNELDDQRCLHHRLLMKKYGDLRIRGWLPLCSDSCSSKCS